MESHQIRTQQALIHRTIHAYEKNFVAVAIFLMIIASVWRMHNEFNRLLFDQSFSGAVDLRFRHIEVNRWFRGEMIYDHKDAIYPPATYVLLWPFLGWLSFPTARWLWAATTVLMMAWLALILLRKTDVTTTKERLFIILLIPSIYSAGATIGNGQLILHLVPPLLFSFFQFSTKKLYFWALPARRMQDDKRQAGTAAATDLENHSTTTPVLQSWRRDLLIALPFLFVMVKPAIALPFLLLMVLLPGGIRPAVFVGLGYVALTAVALLFQDTALVTLIQEWLARGSAAAIRGGYANLHSWLVSLNLSSWILPASLILLASFGVWSFFHRTVHLWILLGVAAYVSRLWIYHRLYDDFLILLPIIALAHVYRRTGSTTAAILFAFTWAAAMAPARILTYPPPWNILYETVQVTIWLSGMVFLLRTAHYFPTQRR